MDNDNEEWKDIPGFDGQYQVSTKGSVRSTEFRNRSTRRRLEIPRLLKAYKTIHGYLQICLRSKKYLVHRLVLTTFVGPLPDGKECGHLDGNRTNNHLSNLKWISRKENSSHQKIHGTCHEGEKHYLAKLTNDQAREIIRLYKEGAPAKKLSKMFNICESTTFDIVAGRRWKVVSRQALESAGVGA